MEILMKFVRVPAALYNSPAAVGHRLAGRRARYLGVMRVHATKRQVQAEKRLKQARHS